MDCPVFPMSKKGQSTFSPSFMGEKRTVYFLPIGKKRTVRFLPPYRWQALQVSPLSGCLSVAAWQVRQTIAELCHVGLGGARSWPGVERWQTAQLPLVASGR